MQTNHDTAAAFRRTISSALAQVKRELQRNYEQAYPALGEIIHLVLDEEESKAWALSSFPHLIFPDLVDAHITKLSLQPVNRPDRTTQRSREHAHFPVFQPAFA